MKKYNPERSSLPLHSYKREREKKRFPSMDHVQQQPIDPSCRQRVSPCHMSFLTSFSVPVSMADAQRFRRGIGTDDKPSTCPCNVDNLMRSTHTAAAAQHRGAEKAEHQVRTHCKSRPVGLASSSFLPWRRLFFVPLMSSWLEPILYTLCRSVWIW